MTSNSSNSVELPSGLSLGNSSDILRGGHGNDGIDGGEGNDIIFGEDELNDSSNVAPVNILDTFNYGHSTYLLSQAATWTEAQAEAQSYGGNLVTINDAAEEAWLKSTFGNSERFWLGMNDVETEGEMQWISGEAVTYTNWASGEPNNWGDGEDYGVTNYGSQWNDDDYSTPYRGIIEIDWSSVAVMILSLVVVEMTKFMVTLVTIYYTVILLVLPLLELLLSNKESMATMALLIPRLRKKIPI